MEGFKSKFGMLAAALGMAIGTGNIWRFPRKAAQYGGSAYILVWLLGLFLWSVPLLLVEAGMGRASKKGVPFAFAELMNKRLTSAGVFVSIVTVMIMFYYSVVTGWCAGYLFTITLNGIPRNPSVFWHGFEGSNQALIWTMTVIIFSGVVVWRGVVKGVERFSLVLMPVLFILLIVMAIYTVLLPGTAQGFHRLFAWNPDSFKDPSLWIDGFSQSAWSTGAGWGLYMTYAAYAPRNKGLEPTTYATGFGNNLASLLAASAIIPLLFTVLPGAGAIISKGNTGLAFIAMPAAFLGIGGLAGRILAVIFFAGLVFAALSSLIAMFEMVVLILKTAGFSRAVAVGLITLITLVAALPSALFPGFFNNQDWVWGLALLISGMAFSLVVIRMGSKRFIDTYLLDISPGSKILVKVCATFVVPLLFVSLLWWYLITTALNTKAHPWGLTNPFGLTLMFLEWAVAALASWWLAKRINKRLMPR